MLPVADTVALDCETFPVSRGQAAPRLVCISLAAGGLEPRLLRRERDTARQIRSLLDGRIVGHNVAFDMAVLASSFPELLPAIFDAYEAGRICDTLITQRMLDIGQGRSLKVAKYDLATLAQLYLDKELDKDSQTSWRLRYGELDHLPTAQWPAAATQYAIDDAVSTLRVFEAQLQCLQPHDAMGLPEDALDDMPVQAYTAFCLQLATCWGVHTDPVAVESLRAATRAQLQGLRLVLLEAGLMRFEAGAYVRNTKIARDRMRATGSKIKTKKGNLSIGAVACKLCGDPGLEAFGQYGRAQSLLTRLDTLAEGYDEPLQSRFVNPLETGRTSCRKPIKGSSLKGDQLQNPPASVEGFRECYVPRDGYVFIDADFGGMELATFAQAALVKVGFSKRAELINAGMDLHLYLAAAELGISYEDAVVRYKQGDPVVVIARTRAKPANFGFLGGMGIEKYTLLCRDKYDMRVTEDEARKQKLVVVRAFPETAPYFVQVDREVKSHQLFRAIRSGRYRGGCSYTDGCNHYFQALGADMANDALRRASRACYIFDGPLYGSRIWNFVHDQLLLEAPLAKYREAAVEVKAHMEAAARLWLPDVKCTVEPIAARCWSKHAKRVTDADGGLGVWAPRHKGQHG